jgi:hypothetical protein
MWRFPSLLLITASLTACSDVLEIPEVHRAACNPDADFTSLAPVPGLGDVVVQSAQLSHDEQTIVFSRKTENRVGDLYIAHRERADDPFGDARALDEVNTALDEFSASISDDLLTLYFDRADHGADDSQYTIYEATRATADDPFAAPTPLALDSDPTVSNFEPFITPYGMYFGSRPPNGFARLFTAAGGGVQFASRQPLTSLETVNGQIAYENPVVSADGLTIYFSAPPDGSLARDVWIAHRDSVGASFAPPRLVASVNTPAVETPSWISPDGCRLYFVTDRAGTAELWLASRRD